jgi:hypothetical protein
MMRRADPPPLSSYNLAFRGELLDYYPEELTEGLAPESP